MRASSSPASRERDRSIGTATFAAGCFWGVEAAFCGVPGVLATAVGYTGGWKPHPSYEQVCTGRTGHAEAVRVEFDPGAVGFDELLDVFWRIHDPARPRPLVGRRSQYRSAIFVHSGEQETVAVRSRDRLAALLQRPLATALERASHFYAAEERHQRYFEKRGRALCVTR